LSDAEALRYAIAEIIPFNHALNISITSVFPDRVELIQPEAPERLNAVGAVHTAASALFMLGEAATEAMVIHAFHHLLKEEGVVPFVVKTTISYYRPTRGELRGISILSSEEQTSIRDEMVSTGRTRFTISTHIHEESGMLVAELESQWGLRKPRVKELGWAINALT